MVRLANPTPQFPVAGGTFEITARDGVGPYEFVYQIDEEDKVSLEQEEDTLKIKIPDTAAGEVLIIQVTDGIGEFDREAFDIMAPEGAL